MTTAQKPDALPVVAYGYENTRPTGEKHPLMMVKLDNAGDQYPELATPLVRLSDAQSTLESERQAHAAEVERLRADAARYQAVRNAGGLLKIYRYDDPADFCSGDWRYKPSPEEVDAWCDAAIDQAIARGKT